MSPVQTSGIEGPAATGRSDEYADAEGVAYKRHCTAENSVHSADYLDFYVPV